MLLFAVDQDSFDIVIPEFGSKLQHVDAISCARVEIT